MGPAASCSRPIIVDVRGKNHGDIAADDAHRCFPAALPLLCPRRRKTLPDAWLLSFLVLSSKIDSQMTRPTCFCWLPACLLFSVSTLFAQTSAPLPIPAGANLKDPAVLWPLAESANSLDDPKTGAWHLKASFESFDANGKPLDTGTFEEWHLGPEKWKRTYTSSQYSQTEYQTPEGSSYETGAGAPPWPLSLIGKELSHPMSEPSEIGGSNAELRPFVTKAVKLSCVMLSQPLRKATWPLGLFPTYCFNAGGDILRLDVFDGSIESARNQIAIFRNTYIGKEIALNDAGQPLLRIHLLELAGMSESEAARVELPKSEPGAPKTVDLSSTVMAGNKLSGPNPQYPVEAKRDHIQGKVVLEATIGTDGRIHDLHIVSSSHDWLSVAAVAAVERWIYKPYTLLGKPVNVLTRACFINRYGLKLGTSA